MFELLLSRKVSGNPGSLKPSEGLAIWGYIGTEWRFYWDLYKAIAYGVLSEY